MRGKIFIRGVIAAIIIAPLVSAQAATIEGVRYSDNPERSRVVFDLSHGVDFQMKAKANPKKLILTLENTIASPGLSSSLEGVGRVSLLNYRRTQSQSLEIELETKGDARAKAFKLPGRDGSGSRVVLDFFSKKMPSTIKPGRSRQEIDRKSAPFRDIVVMIDPGHGGKDPGALGPSGSKEKDVVLRLSKMIAERLNQYYGFQGKLTRKTDRYLHLRERTEIARKNNSDLLVSVHADAFRTPEPKGASVFVLSQSGATSEMARWMAKKENEADLIGGSGKIRYKGKGKDLATVLLDLSMTSTINESIKIGKHVLNTMGSVTDLHKPHIEQAAFVVLKSPDIPSMLVEAGFLSNPQEERRLKTRHHLSKLSRSISKGIVDYFKRRPPPGTHFASRK